VGRHWYLVAFDEVVRREWRIYRVDQVVDPRALAMPRALARLAPRLPDDLSPLEFVRQRLGSALA
jgi:predicted DNA-binding transcriptional regulator YafY